VAKCKFSLRFGQVTSRYVLSYVSVIKNSKLLSPFASMSTSNSLIFLTLFRCYASTFFVQNSRGISRVSPWSLRHGISQRKGHSRVARGVVLRKRRRTESMNSYNRSNGGRGEGGNNGPMAGDVESGEFDVDRYTNITKWLDEVDKDKTESRVVSDDAPSSWLHIAPLS